MEKTCIICGKLFSTNLSKKILCSEECHKKRANLLKRNKKNKLICTNCKKEYLLTKDFRNKKLCPECASQQKKKLNVIRKEELDWRKVMSVQDGTLLITAFVYNGCLRVDKKNSVNLLQKKTYFYTPEGRVFINENDLERYMQKVAGKQEKQ